MSDLVEPGATSGAVVDRSEFGRHNGVWGGSQARQEDWELVVEKGKLTLQGAHEVQAPDFCLGVAEAHLDLWRGGKCPSGYGGHLTHVVGGRHEEVECDRLKPKAPFLEGFFHYNFVSRFDPRLPEKGPDQA